MSQKDFIVFDEIDEHGPQSYSRTFEIPASELDREDELAAIGPVKLDVTASAGDSPGEYVVDGTAAFTADFTCARCVDPYPFANSSTFHLRYRARPEGSGEAEEEIELSEGELDIEFYTEPQISLRDLAVEQIQLSIPMKPLCDEKCLGLCPTCGANRNREACACEKSVVDARWGALQGIRDELAKKKDV